MNLQDFNYDLPENLIAQEPLKFRDKSKLMILDKITGNIIHDKFYNIINYIKPNDCLVLNNTKVTPSRLFGNKKDTNGKLEILILKKISLNSYEILVTPGKNAKIGNIILFGNDILIGKITDILEDGHRIIKFEYQGNFEEILNKIGEMPLPHYIKKKLEDKNRYQTVFSKYDGSIAAPTAGLHFTNELIQKIKDAKINIAYVTLHVGLGTFKPVKTENILDHKMHSEYFNLEQSQVDIINKSKLNGGKIISVGTTSCRTLESCINKDGFLEAKQGNTEIFIYPSYKFKIVDSLITNFHLPKSTLLMLVSALASKENILKSYKEAVNNKYRFFSFGDSMFIK